jgi:nucleoside triphosphate pyrophosphatase
MNERLILASASPRRAVILRALGVPFRVVVSEVDETLVAGEDPARAVERLACEKAQAVARRETLLPILGADTVVVAGGAVLGKPTTPEEAAAMLRSLAGRDHHVLTGLALASGGRVRSAVDRTTVRFAAMTDAEIEWYVSTGEPMDKAGAYHIDGRGALFVESVTGSPSNVAGLPIRVLHTLAFEADIDLTGSPR